MKSPTPTPVGGGSTGAPEAQAEGASAFWRRKAAVDSRVGDRGQGGRRKTKSDPSAPRGARGGAGGVSLGPVGREKPRAVNRWC